MSPTASPHTSSRLPATEQLQLLQARWRRDWRFFHYHTLGGPPLTPDQEALWDHVANHERTLVGSGHGTGKDFDIGRIVPWFLFAYTPSVVITTAPTDRQVEKIIWGEVHAAAARSRVPLGGKLLEKEWVINRDTKHYAIGFTSKDTDASSQHFQGFHGAHVLVVLSEAPGIHESVWAAIDGLTMGAVVRILAVGQPVGEVGAYFEASRAACHKGPQCLCPEWHWLNLSSWDAATFAEQLGGVPGMATRRWCEERKKKWGEDSAFYISRVLGLIAKQTVGQIIPLSLAARAQELELPTSGACGLGIDVAGAGEDGDDSTFCVVRGNRQTRLDVLHGADTLALAQHAVQLIREEREAVPDQPLKTVAVDVGYNPGVFDQLVSVSEELGLSVIPVNFGAPANRDDEFFDKGAEMWWALRADLKVGTFQLLPPTHPEAEELLAEMTSRQVSKKWDKLGRVRLESKDELRRRGRKSPDRTDATLLAREACRQQTSPMLTSTEPAPAEEDAAIWNPVG